MDSDIINWLHLPDIMWESILLNLEFICLLNASETCKRFNDLLSMSQRLMKKVRLEIGPYKDLKLIKECLLKSERKYDSIIIRALVNNSAENDIIDVIVDILKHFAGSVKQITFLKTSLQDDNFFKIIQILKNLKVLKFKGRDCGLDHSKNTEVVRPDIISSINEISIEEVGKFSFQKLDLFDNLITLDVNDYMSTVDETFDNFLLRQKNLKVLHLRDLYHAFLFKTDKLTKNIKFSLDELTLDEVYWTDNENAMKFFTTQTNIKKVTINLQNLYFNRLDGEMCYNELLIHFFGNNLQLNTVNLSTYGYIIKDFSFLEGIVNPSVENLDFRLDSSQNATELLAAFTKLFPNVKNFSYLVRTEDSHGLDQIHKWKLLESINCNLRDNQFFENVNLVENLTNCTITCIYGDCIRKNRLMNFLNHHQNIKHMTINPHICAIELDEIIFLIVNALKSLETLTYKGKKMSLLNNSKIKTNYLIDF